MTLPKLLSHIPMLAGYYGPETGWPLPRAFGGDLPGMIVIKLNDSFDPDASDREQLLGAMERVNNLESALRDEVYSRLHDAINRLPVESPKYIVNGLDVRALVLVGDTLRHLTPFQIEHTLIFYLLSGAEVVCPKCALTRDLVAEKSVGFYAINVIPYSQSCHECGQTIVDGWPVQIFEKPTDAYAVIRLNRDGLPEVDMSTLRPTEDKAYLASEYPVIGVVRCGSIQ